MTSTILYKFRSATTYESISLPGSSARLFDIKRAIVKAKSLDKNTSNSLEFDFKITNAMTNESYDDETMVLPRGTRLIVSRLPAAKGQGLLARFARADAGLSSGVAVGGRYGNPKAAESGYYTVTNNDEEEFVDGTTMVEDKNTSNNIIINNNNNVDNNHSSNHNHNDDDDEEAKLRAVIPGQSTTTHTIYNRNNNNATTLTSSSNTIAKPPQPSSIPNNKFKQHHNIQSTNMNYPARPNADPTLREMEQQQQALENSNKRRKTGIPRTFHQPGGSDDADNTKAFETGFNQLLDRGGGQSSISKQSKKRDLEYALQLTATEIPEHLQCGICARVVKDALFVPWDDEGRTACDLCMRKGLSENRLRCPLTGQDGVSPDELRPNKGLRKAAELFESEVMEQMEKIIQQQEADEEQEREERKALEAKEKELQQQSNDYEGDTSEKGVVMRKGLMNRGGNRKSYDDDPFGGEDDFGGDVFAVTRVREEEQNEEEEEGNTMETNENEENNEDEVEISNNAISKNIDAVDMEKTLATHENTTDNVKNNAQSKNDENVDSSSILQSSQGQQQPKQTNVITSDESLSSQQQDPPNHHQRQQSKLTSPTSTAVNRREMLKNRGPPAGYVMGPAGANPNSPSAPALMTGRGGRGNFQGRGGRGYYRGGHHDQRGRGANRFNNNFQHYQQVRAFHNTLFLLIALLYRSSNHVISS